MERERGSMQRASTSRVVCYWWHWIEVGRLYSFSRGKSSLALLILRRGLFIKSRASILMKLAHVNIRSYSDRSYNIRKLLYERRNKKMSVLQFHVYYDCLANEVINDLECRQEYTFHSFLPFFFFFFFLSSHILITESSRRKSLYALWQIYICRYKQLLACALDQIYKRPSVQELAFEAIRSRVCFINLLSTKPPHYPL